MLLLLTRRGRVSRLRVQRSGESSRDWRDPFPALGSSLRPLTLQLRYIAEIWGQILLGNYKGIYVPVMARVNRLASLITPQCQELPLL